MQTKAIYKYARVTPRKARRVVDLVRGKKAGEAMISLKFMPYKAAKLIEKTVRSAMANAEQKSESIDVEQLRITKIVVDAGPTMRRMMPRAMGRGNIIRKRTSHITVHLAGEED